MKRWTFTLFLACLAPASWASDPWTEAGGTLYAQHCASCHQPGGEGVLTLQPNLKDRPRAEGAADGIVDVILYGSGALLPMKDDYANEMPAFGNLSDREVAQLATYVRSVFGNTPGLVRPADVARRRGH